MHVTFTMAHLLSLNKEWHRKIVRFIKAQCSALIASATDYGVTALLLGYTLLPYACSTLLGCLSGGLCNCTINYKWVFQIHQGHKTRIGIRYLLVWSTSLLLNVGGTCLLAHFWCQNNTALTHPYSPEKIYMISRILISICCALLWNYPMQQFFVYKINHQTKPIQDS